MRLTTVSKLKATISHYLRAVKAGEEVLVMERGKPIARIVPVTGVSDDEARRADLIGRGLLRPGRGRIREEVLAGLPVVRVPDEAIAEVIAAEREEP